MALDEREEVREHLEDVEEGEGSDMDERRTQVSSQILPVNEIIEY